MFSITYISQSTQFNAQARSLSILSNLLRPGRVFPPFSRLAPCFPALFPPFSQVVPAFVPCSCATLAHMNTFTGGFPGLQVSFQAHFSTITARLQQAFSAVTDVVQRLFATLHSEKEECSIMTIVLFIGGSLAQYVAASLSRGVRR